MLFKHSVWKKTQRVFIANINWWMLRKKIYAVYSENHKEYINIFLGVIKNYEILKKLIYLVTIVF